MKKLLIFAIIFAIGLFIYNSLKPVPKYVQINQDMTKQCTIDMDNNPELLCD